MLLPFHSSNNNKKTREENKVDFPFLMGLSGFSLFSATTTEKKLQLAPLVLLSSQRFFLILPLKPSRVWPHLILY